MRATFNTTYRGLNTSLQRINRDLEDLRLTAATGKQVRKPSDAPTAINPILTARTQIKGYERYLTNIDNALNRTDTTDVQLDTMENIMVRAKEIAVAAVNDSNNTLDRQTYANEVAQLRDALVDVANAKFNGEYLFSGYLTTDASMGGNPPFTLAGGVATYNGDANSTSLEIGPGEQIAIGVPGNQFLQPATGVDVFTALTNLETALLADDPTAIGNTMPDLETGAEQIRTQRSLLGNTGRRLEDAKLQTTDIKLDKQELLSSYEDADLLEVIAQMQQQEVALEAALNVTGKVTQLSILDYI